MQPLSFLLNDVTRLSMLSICWGIFGLKTPLKLLIRQTKSYCALLIGALPALPQI